MSQLIITNGDSAADILGSAGLGGRIVPWRDVLHEGPLTPADSLEAFSRQRAAYLSRRFSLPLAEAMADFLARDAVVRAHRLFDEVQIWLEHDLYDQLQLLQILDFFHSEGRADGLTLVQADDFLGSQQPDNVLRFTEDSLPLTRPLLDSASAVWQALCQPTPEPVLARMASNPGEFPFLGAAIGRFLEELPASGNGLSRTENVIAAAVAAGGLTPRDLFQRLLASEEAAFMGDWSAFRTLDDLVFAADPLLTGIPHPFPCQGTKSEIADYIGAPLALTDFGRSVLSGGTDMIAVNGADRWWAGTRLEGHDCWRWDSASRRPVPPAAAGPDQSR
jgi:hypothetical protein